MCPHFTDKKPKTESFLSLPKFAVLTNNRGNKKAKFYEFKSEAVWIKSLQDTKSSVITANLNLLKLWQL